MQASLEDNVEIKKTLGISLVGITPVSVTSVQENQGGRLDAARPADGRFGSIFWSEFEYNLKKYHP